ncbi:MAG: hypothetical protein MPK62_14525, partial [Alphaproteobacteria bacterium]|nr:hypothetical protein [Alphaproteobacteria bacterium]
LLVAKEFVDKLIANLNQFIFAEEVSFHKLNCSPIYLQGPKLPELYNYLKLPSYKKNHIIKTLDYLIVNLSLTGDEGALFLALKEDLPNKQTTKEKSTLDIIIDKDKSLLAILDEKKVIKIDEKIFNLFRIEAGVPILGLDYDYDNMLLEVDSQDEMLDVNKGCYPGQETIARTLSRGSVQKKIFGLKHQDNELKLGDTLYFRGKSIAEIKSTIYSLNFNSYLSLAFIHRDYWFNGKEFRFEKIPNDFKSRKGYTVQQLPFDFGSNLLHSAQKELDQGMKAFHQNNHHQAKIHLNQALTIHPRFPDAVEALAVIEERLDNIDKAIEHNKQFAKLDPNAIMARTNLSRLYMKKGWIEKAE